MWGVVAVMTAVSVGLLVVGIRGWRDRPLGVTFCWLGGGIFALLIPAGATGSPTLVLVVLLVLIVGLPLLALVAELRQRAERRHQKELALSTGMDPDRAALEYRRAPRGPVVIMLIYGLIAMLWVLVFFLVSVALNEPRLASAPGWELPGADGGPPLKLSWWLMGMFSLTVAGLAHAAVNVVRRP
jgi:hypothetical protein